MAALTMAGAISGGHAGPYPLHGKLVIMLFFFLTLIIVQAYIDGLIHLDNDTQRML